MVTDRILLIIILGIRLPFCTTKTSTNDLEKLISYFDKKFTFEKNLMVIITYRFV